MATLSFCMKFVVSSIAVFTLLVNYLDHIWVLWNLLLIRIHLLIGVLLNGNLLIWILVWGIWLIWRTLRGFLIEKYGVNFFVFSFLEIFLTSLNITFDFVFYIYIYRKSKKSNSHIQFYCIKKKTGFVHIDWKEN